MRIFTVMALLLGMLACAGLVPKTPWQGEAQFVATLSSESPTGSGDGKIIAERLEDQGVSVIVTELSPKKLKLEVSGARDPEILSLVTKPYQLEIGTLRNEHVKSAAQERDEFAGYPIVEVILTNEGGQRFCELTMASVGKKIEIKVDGDILNAPVVMEPVCGGTLQLTMGGDGMIDDLVDEATALEVALSTSPLASEWTVETLE